MKHTFAIRFLAAFALVGILSSQLLVFAEQQDADVGAIPDVSTVFAGSGFTLSVPGLTPGMTTTLLLHKPGGSVIPYQITADSAGVLHASVDAFHTMRAGVYKYELLGMPGFEGYVDVRGGQMSLQKSTLEADKTLIVNNGADMAQVTVTLRDVYDNPIEGERMTLISTRDEDLIEPSHVQMTDQYGRAVFTVRSLKEGLAVMTAISADATPLGQRLSLVFGTLGSVLSTGESEAMGGPRVANSSGLGASLVGGVRTAQAASTQTINADKLTLTIEPRTTMKVFELFDLVVEAKTATNQPALDYRGTIEFLSDDPEAVLPGVVEKFTFTGTEQPAASKRFTLAGQFKKAGSKKIIVRDVSNPALSAEVSVQVTAETTGTGSLVSEILLTSPVSGVLTTGVIDVTGTASPNADLLIMDNGLEVGKVRSTATGAFTYTLRGLSDGTHQIQVKWQDTNGVLIAESQVVQVTLRQSGPAIKSTSWIPQKTSYLPGEKVELVVETESGLTESSVSLSNKVVPLVEQPSQPGRYIAKIDVPALPGSYDLTVALKNALGLTENKLLTGALVVKAPAFDLTTLKYTLTDPTTAKVTWSNPLQTGEVAGYAIAFGVEATNLTAVQPVPLKETSFVFTDLPSDKTVYFEFRVLDSNGSVIQRDAVKSLTTPPKLTITSLRVDPKPGLLSVTWDASGPVGTIKKYRIVYGLSPETYTQQKVVDAGTKILDLAPLADGAMHYFRIQALGADDTPIAQSGEVTGKPGVRSKPAAAEVCVPADVENIRLIYENEEKFLVWDPASKAEGYVVHAGTKPGIFDLPQVRVGATKYQISGLNTQIPYYYFAVTAYCGDQQSKSLSQALKVASGPAVWLLLLASCGCAGYATYLRRRKQLATEQVI